MAMIDSNKLYRRIAGHSKYSGDAILTAISCLAEGKEIHDVPWLKNCVEVVRCEDCFYSEPLSDYMKKQYGDNVVRCNHHLFGLNLMRKELFCCFGERRDGD